MVFLKPDIVILSQRINLCVDIKAIEHYITSISKEDKMSFDYRYPITKALKSYIIKVHISM